MMISSPKKILLLCFVITIFVSSCDFVNAQTTVESSTDSDDSDGPGESPGYRYCNICRAHRTYTLPDKVISIPTQGDYTCALLDQRSREGFVPPDRCPNLQAFTSGERCGCVLKSSLSTPSPTPGPTPGPTPAPASASTNTGGFGGPFRGNVGGRGADDNDAGVSIGTATSTTYNGMHEGEGTTTDAHHTYNGEHETIDFSFLGDPNVENGVVIDEVSTSTNSGGGGGGTTGHSHAVVIPLVLAVLVGLGQ